MTASALGSLASGPGQEPPGSLQKIEHFVVLMLENRSFDHLVGYLKGNDVRIAGLTGSESNYRDPRASLPVPVPVARVTSFMMPFDPGHEFNDVQVQLYGPSTNVQQPANPPVASAPMNGFVYSAGQAAQLARVPASAARIMECFQPDQMLVMTALARGFALCNYWYSSLPGPTWPNRFFVHAATSGGLTDSPSTDQIVEGFSFASGTIYERLEKAGRDWRIYHDGLPQTAGIDSLRLEYVDPFTKHFRGMNFFDQDLAAGSLPAYVFIEPNYDTGHNYVRGNSMHPLNDIRKGEQLVKRVYEALRGSRWWDSSLLIITFDEHGGFYDHVPPPTALPSGDDSRYRNPSHPFAFDRLGVRVPAILVSAYTTKGSVIDRDANGARCVFDHASILATAEKRFGLAPLTRRDAAAQTLEVGLGLQMPREDAPVSLPSPLTDSLLVRFARLFRKKPPAASAGAPLSENQKSLLGLALACDLKVSDASEHQAIRSRHAKIVRQKEAAGYIREVEAKIQSRRR